MQFESGKRLKDLTSFGIGGIARFFVEVASIEHLKEVLCYCKKQQLSYLPLGKGSNILCDDRGFNGVVILNKINFIEEKESLFRVGAGYSFSLLGTQTARKGFQGLEFASGIPGSVGGAIYMNAGANGSETFDCLKEVSFVNENGEIEIFYKKELQWGYRFSSFQEKKGVIADASFELTPSLEARQKQLKIIDYRTKTQPYGEKSAGCVFRNAEQQSAGALIEKCGLKGFRIGGAQVSLVHANFIVNYDNATAEDIKQLACYVQTVVQEKTGILLEMEVRVIPY